MKTRAFKEYARAKSLCGLDALSTHYSAAATAAAAADDDYDDDDGDDGDDDDDDGDDDDNGDNDDDGDYYTFSDSSRDHRCALVSLAARCQMLPAGHTSGRSAVGVPLVSIALRRLLLCPNPVQQWCEDSFVPH